MAIAVYFRPAGLNAERYQQIFQRMSDAGHASPEGRLYHVCLGEADRLMVFEVWDSQDSFRRHGEKLMPVIGETQVDPGRPEITPILNIIKGN